MEKNKEIARAGLVYVAHGKEDPDYDGIGTNIDEVLEVSTKAKNARDIIRKDYNGQVKCIVQLVNRCQVNVSLEEVRRGSLEAALKDYISIAGLPENIGYGSDMDICNRVLAAYGQTAKWRLIGFGLGRQVEELKGK